MQVAHLDADGTTKPTVTPQWRRTSPTGRSQSQADSSARSAVAKVQTAENRHSLHVAIALDGPPIRRVPTESLMRPCFAMEADAPRTVRWAGALP